MRSISGAIAILLVCCAPATALSTSKLKLGELTIDFADPKLAPKPGVEQDYVAKYLAAIASKDSAQFRALIHPTSQACLADEAGQKFLGYLEARAFKRNIPENATIVMTAATSDLAPKPGAGAMTFVPAPPELVMAIDYEYAGKDAEGMGAHAGETVLDLLAAHDGKLMLITHCLTPEGGKTFLERLKNEGK